MAQRLCRRATLFRVRHTYEHTDRHTDTVDMFMRGLLRLTPIGVQALLEVAHVMCCIVMFALCHYDVILGMLSLHTQFAVIFLAYSTAISSRMYTRYNTLMGFNKTLVKPWVG